MAKDLLNSAIVKVILATFVPLIAVVALSILSPQQALAVDGTCSGGVPNNCKCTCPSGYEPAGNCSTECTGVFGTPVYTGTCSCKKIEPAYTCREECLAAGGDTSECKNLPPCPTESEKRETCLENCLAAGNDRSECNRTCSSNPDAYPSSDDDGNGISGSTGINPPEPKTTVDTPLGPIPTDPVGLAGWVLKLGIGLGSLLAVLFIIVGGIGVATSTGDPKNLEKAKSQITAAIAGLVFLLCSALILNIIGCEIIGIKDVNGACPFTL